MFLLENSVEYLRLFGKIIVVGTLVKYVGYLSTIFGFCLTFMFPTGRKSTIQKCIVNAIPVTNPIQYTKLAKEMVTKRNLPIIGNSDFAYFLDNSPY